MKTKFELKIRTKQSSSSTLTTTVMADNASAAKADIKKRYPGCTVISCIQK